MSPYVTLELPMTFATAPLPWVQTLQRTGGHPWNVGAVARCIRTRWHTSGHRPPICWRSSTVERLICKLRMWLNSAASWHPVRLDRVSVCALVAHEQAHPLTPPNRHLNTGREPEEGL